MNLYEMSVEYENIFNSIFDEETGEINELSLLRLEEKEKNIKEKSIAVASFIEKTMAEEKAIEDAIKRMAKRKKSLSSKSEFLTNYLLENMDRCNIKEISCPFFQIKLKICPASVDVLNENDVPEEYKKIKSLMTIDKVKIKEAIQTGKSVQGAKLVNKKRIEIK